MPATGAVLQSHEASLLRLDRRAGGLSPRSFFTAGADSAEHVMRGLAAVFTGVVYHVWRARIDRQEAQFLGARSGKYGHILPGILATSSGPVGFVGTGQHHPSRMHDGSSPAVPTGAAGWPWFTP